MPNMAHFKGDGDHLVDRLVEASRMPTYDICGSYRGRELQAWVDDTQAPLPAIFDAPLEAPSARPHNEKIHNYNNHAAAAPPKRARGPSSPARRCSLEQAGQGSYACPSFAAAPKPEALPMPTSSLLTRALYRRSPSPPKLPTATAVMA